MSPYRREREKDGGDVGVREKERQQRENDSNY
jgi:hypothetical protein